MRPTLLNVFLKEEVTSLYLRMQWITENSNTAKRRSIKRRAIDSRTLYPKLWSCILHLSSHTKKIDSVRIFSCYCSTEIHQTHLSTILRGVLKACFFWIIWNGWKTSDCSVASKL